MSVCADNRIYLLTHSVPDFFDYIGKCPEEISDIYGYKWLKMKEERGNREESLLSKQDAKEVI